MASAVGLSASKDARRPETRPPRLGGGAGEEHVDYKRHAVQRMNQRTSLSLVKQPFVDRRTQDKKQIYPALSDCLLAHIIPFLGYYVNLFGVFGFLLGECLLLLHRLSVERRNKIHQSPRNARGWKGRLVHQHHSLAFQRFPVGQPEQLKLLSQVVFLSLLVLPPQP